MKTKLIALSAIALLSASAAVPALGYPAGQAPVLGLSSASRIIPGDNITVQVSRVKAGCSVTVFWVGEGISSGAKTVKANGKTSSPRIWPMPRAMPLSLTPFLLLYHAV